MSYKRKNIQQCANKVDIYNVLTRTCPRPKYISKYTYTLYEASDLYMTWTEQELVFITL